MDFLNVPLASGGIKGILSPMTAKQAYDQLAAQSRRLQAFSSAASLAWWDEETGMPPKGLSWRAQQVEVLVSHQHEQFASERTGEWIAACEAGGLEAGSFEEANVALWRRAYDQAVKLPTDLVAEEAATATRARSAWAAARKANDFAAFLPWLEKSVELRRRRAECLGYEEHPYDALLDMYERGMRTAEVRELFGRLRPGLVDLAGRAAERSTRIPEDLLAGEYTEEGQREFNRRVAEAIGFDFEGGRIDTSTHPFCSRIGPGDVRLTNRYRSDDFSDSLFGILHEAGHGLYEQGLPEEWFGLPAGKSVSLGVHESQSRLWENHVGRSLPFWEKWLPTAVECFPHLKDRTPADMVRALTRSRRGFIRVGSDEATYDLHILLRFELEVALVEGSLEARDVPGEWNKRFHELFGLEVPDHTRGCLQDIHWSMGAIGYFATYTLGNLNAAHLLEAARAGDAGLAAAMDRGEYAPLLAWMRERIHRHGNLVAPTELVARAAGSPMDEKAFLGRLERVYVDAD